MTRTKIYTTTFLSPVADIRELVGKLTGQGRYRHYVTATSKAKAAEALAGANMMASPIHSSYHAEIKIATGYEVEALTAAGLFDVLGNVVVLDEHGHRNVVLIKENDGHDPRVVGTFEVRDDEDGFGVQHFVRTSGEAFPVPARNGAKAYFLKHRAAEQAEAKAAQDLADATGRVREFLDVFTARKGLDPAVVHELGTKDGILPLLTADLMLILDAAQKD